MREAIIKLTDEGVEVLISSFGRNGMRMLTTAVVVVFASLPLVVAMLCRPGRLPQVRRPRVHFK